MKQKIKQKTKQKTIKTEPAKTGQKPVFIGFHCNRHK